jgi:hypothetical protein
VSESLPPLPELCNASPGRISERNGNIEPMLTCILYPSYDIPVFDSIDRHITNASGRTHRDPPPHRRGLDRGASTSLSGSLWLIRRRWISMRCHPGVRCRSSGLIAGNLDVVQVTRTLLPWFDLRIPLLELLAIRKLVVDKGRFVGPRSAGDVLSSSKDFRNYHTIPIEQADGSPIVVGSFRSQRTGRRMYGSHDVMNGRGLTRFPSVAVSQFPMN